MCNPLKYYSLESYLFEDVHQRFHADHSIGAFDFFSIVIWKSNRAKSKIARKLLTRDPQGRQDLEAIVRHLTRLLYEASDHKKRLKLLIKDWHFALPMASAVLSVLWPDDFTVYDARVCDQLGKFHNLYNRTDFDKIWAGYLEFKANVTAMTPQGLSLRDQDRYLWGKAVVEQLQTDVQHLFRDDEKETV